MGPAQSMCGQNILNTLMQKYGGDVLSFIAAEKSKLLIDDKFIELERKFHESFQDFQNTVQQITETKKSQILSAFDGLKNKANSLLPGGVAALERVKGKSINQFSGFNNLIAKVDSIKLQALSNLTLKKQQMIQKLGEQKQKMTKNIDKSKPSIPVYDQVPQPIKRQLFVEAEKKFSKQLSSNQQQIEQKIMGLFNASALQKMFTQMSPQSVLDRLLAQGFSLLEKNILVNVTGGSLGGTFGNIIGNPSGYANIFGNVLN